MIDTSLKNAHILIVDDLEANIDILTGLLEMQGYLNIETTTDSREVFHLFEIFKPDLLLLDLSMPYLTGFDVMDQLKTLLPENSYFPILVLTADATSQAKLRALSSGASDFLTKPFDLIEVGLRIKNLLYSSHLHQQLQHQNIYLEEIVHERTQDIVKTNIELIESRNKAEASDRLKTAFLQNISHEIRTPLNGILGFGSLLTDQDITPEEKKSYYDLMQTSSNRLINTITDYIDISLIMSDSLEINFISVDVIRLLNELEINFQNLCQLKKLSFNLLIPDNTEALNIITDPEYLRKIISHLIDNALKFTNKGNITLGYSLNHNDIEFYIKDTGVGISENAQELIFDSFMQENSLNTRNHEGSGLGLTISKNLVEKIGGKIWLKSVKNEGSVFYFTIPFKSDKNV